MSSALDAKDKRDQATSQASGPADPEEIVRSVKQRYGRIAAQSTSGCCSGAAAAVSSPDAEQQARQLGYEAEDLEAIPREANLGLGSGAPIRHLDLRPGETVLDLGSGPGLDVLLAAARVGTGGRAIGVDMTPEMIERARMSAGKAGLAQADFRLGRLEALPVQDASVDAVTSNCVINLVPDKARVFREIARVLRPAGRAVISDVLLDAPLPAALGRDLQCLVGCVAGALLREEYFALVRAAGLSDLEVLEDVEFPLPAEVQADPAAMAFLDRNAAALQALRGKVRSITFRVRKS